MEIGRDIALLSEEVVLLNRDLEIVRTTKPQLASPAPIAGSSHTHEYQRDPFYATRTSVFPALAENRSAMSLLSRYWTAPDARPDPRLPHPMDGLHLLDAAGEVVADLQRDCQVDDRPGRGGVLDRADRRADRSCVPPPRRGVAGVR